MEDIFLDTHGNELLNVTLFFFFCTTEWKKTISINPPGFDNAKNKISLMSYQDARGADSAQDTWSPRTLDAAVPLTNVTNLISSHANGRLRYVVWLIAYFSNELSSRFLTVTTRKVPHFY